MIKRFTVVLLLLSFLTSAKEVKSPIDLGNFHMMNKNYTIAVNHYVDALSQLSAHDKGSQFAYICEQLAIANLKLKNYSKSVYYFDQAVKSELRTPTALFEYAKLLVTLKQFDKASALFTEWGEISDNQTTAESYTSFISNIQNNTQASHDIEVKKTLWSTDKYNEFCPIIHPSGDIIYTSDQPSVKNSKNNRAKTYPMNLYSISRSSDYDYVPESSPLFAKKSGFNRGTGCLTADGKTLYFTGNTETSIPAFSTKSPQYKLGIFVSHFDGYRWSKPEAINISNAKNNFAFPTLSQRGDTMIFSSDAMGGQGAMDLFYSVNTNGIWSTPVNLGDQINTTGDDLYPRLQYDGNRHTLYFSSDGRPGYGGLDIYQTLLSSVGVISVDILPQPINSPYDDFGFVASMGNAFGYISSNRQGNDDVYAFGEVTGQVVTSNSINKPTVAQPVKKPIEPVKVASKDTIVTTTPVVIPYVPTVKTTPVESESKPKVVVTKNTPDIVETVKNETYTEPTAKVIHSDTEIIESNSLSGYYMVVYSVKDKSGFVDYRNEKFPDAVIVRNKNGFYHLAYYLADTRAEASTLFKNRESRFSKSWVTHF
jgi:hypothetical protein